MDYSVPHMSPKYSVIFGLGMKSVRGESAQYRVWTYETHLIVAGVTWLSAENSFGKLLHSLPPITMGCFVIATIGKLMIFSNHFPSN